MELKPLKYFARIVELGSITAAAQSLFVAQPSLSQHVANLESELGSKLLNRGAQGVTPTASGELLYQYAKTILRQVEAATVAVKQESSDPAGHVLLGLPTSTSRMVAVDLLAEITSRYQQISLEIVEAATAELAESVARQKLDMTVGVDVSESAKFDVYPLLVEDLMLVGPAGAEMRSPVPLERIGELPLVLPSFPNSVRVKMEQACTQQGWRYRVIAESSVASIMAGAARAGFAWTILPWATFGGEADHSLQCLEIQGRPLNRSLSLCVSKAAASNSACHAVRQALIRIIQDKVRSGHWRHAHLISPP